MIKAKNLPTWSERVRAMMKNQKLSGAELAARLNVRPATVSEWITGKREPQGAAVRLLQLLERNPSALDLIADRKAF